MGGYALPMTNADSFPTFPTFPTFSGDLTDEYALALLVDPNGPQVYAAARAALARPMTYTAPRQLDRFAPAPSGGLRFTGMTADGLACYSGPVVGI